MDNLKEILLKRIMKGIFKATKKSQKKRKKIIRAKRKQKKIARYINNIMDGMGSSNSFVSNLHSIVSYLHLNAVLERKIRNIHRNEWEKIKNSTTALRLKRISYATKDGR